jgi:hypothetical protein
VDDSESHVHLGSLGVLARCKAGWSRGDDGSVQCALDVMFEVARVGHNGEHDCIIVRR